MINNTIDYEELFDSIFTQFKEVLVELNDYTLPSVSQIAIKYEANPYLILLSTLISLRTKDEVTLKASDRLFSLAQTPEEMLELTPEAIEKAIYPSLYYKRKTQNIIKISQILITEYNSQVPNEAKALLTLPGVGIKTANLTLNLGFNIEAICVDCHVHTVANRMGLIKTTTPEDSVVALSAIMPKRFWIPLNELFVSYGMQVCTPQSPRCSLCPRTLFCPKIGVGKTR